MVLIEELLYNGNIRFSRVLFQNRKQYFKIYSTIVQCTEMFKFRSATLSFVLLTPRATLVVKAGMILKSACLDFSLDQIQ